MLSFYNDKDIKFEYDPQINKYQFNVNQIGPGAGETITAKNYTDTDANSIYLDGAAGNDGNAGTKASPKLTMLASINACTVDKTKVLVLNSQTFNEDIQAYSNAYFEGIYADTGITAYLDRRILGFTPANANSIFFDKTGDDGNAGTMAAPKLTIAGAIAACDGTHQAIVCQDSETYEEAGIEFTGNFKGMYAAIGQSPTYKPVVDPDLSDYSMDETVLDVTTFKTGTVSECCGITLSNDNVFIAYHNSGSNGSFQIYSELGVSVKSETTFHAGTIYFLGGLKLSNDNILLYYSTAAVGDGYFVIYDEDGNVVKAETVYKAAKNSFLACATLTNDNFVIVYIDDASSDSYFKVYSEDGSSVEVAETLVATDGTVSQSVCSMSNDTFVISGYNAIDGTDKGHFRIYSNAGALQKKTKFTENSIFVYNILVLDNTDFLINFYDQTDGQKGKFVIYDITGNTNRNSVTWADYDIRENVYGGNNVCLLNNGNCFFSFFVESDSDGKFFIYYPYSFYGLKISTAATVNGFIVDADNKSQLAYLVETNSAKPTIRWCELKNCTNPANTDYTAGTIGAYVLYGDNDIDLRYCLIHDNHIGIYNAANLTTIEDCVLYWHDGGYAIHINGTAASNGDIRIEHNTIFGNYGGIRLQSNHGTKEYLKNNIIHDSDQYAINAQTAQTFTYTCYTNSLNNGSASTSVIKANPLFINEGAAVPADIDLTLKLKVIGYPADSPAYLLADDTRDCGAYFINLIGSTTTWTTFTLEKPPTIKVYHEASGPTKNNRRDGSISSSREAYTEYVEIEWEGVTASDYANILLLFTADSNEVRIYPDPTTNASSYNTYTLLYDDSLNASAPHYKITEDGYEKIKLIFARAYA